MTYYCAELVNTLTNLIFVYLGIKGIRNCLLYSPKPSLILAYLGYLTVSLGSMAFHATLKCTQDPFPVCYCYPHIDTVSLVLQTRCSLPMSCP
jgi:hypothetical protein